MTAVGVAPVAATERDAWSCVVLVVGLALPSRLPSSDRHHLQASIAGCVGGEGTAESAAGVPSIAWLWAVDLGDRLRTRPAWAACPSFGGSASLACARGRRPERVRAARLRPPAPAA